MVSTLFSLILVAYETNLVKFMELKILALYLTSKNSRRVFPFVAVTNDWSKLDTKRVNRCDFA